MALDLNTLLPTDWNMAGMPREQGLAILESLNSKLYQDPSSVQVVNAQIQEMFGPQVAQAIINQALPTIGNTPITVQNGAESPTQVTVQDLLNNQAQNAANNQNPTITPLASLPSGSTPTNPQGGLYSHNGSNFAFGTPTSDIERIIAEAEFQKKTATNTLNQQDSARKKYLTDLGGILEAQQSRQLSEEAPEIYEDLNSRGILRSSALGDRLSLRKKELAALTSDALAKQGLAYNNQYTDTVGGITDKYLSDRSTGLSRYFSLEDMNTNIKASKELGFALQPAAPSSGGKGGGVLAGGLGGADLGFKIGAGTAHPAGGPLGAIIGGTAGIIAGGVGSKGK